MPRVTHFKAADQAKQYYSFSDYYEGGSELLRGQWFGRGAEMLGLTGDVQEQTFHRLVDNQHPADGSPLTARNRADRRYGSDITFSAPKSVSLLWGITGDQAIAQAVLASARETLADIEQDALTRVNLKRGVMTTAKTGNLVGATWLHTTARPVGEYADPQLHVHGWLANATHDRKRWTAVDLSAIVRDSKLYDNLFQARLAAKLVALGYPVERSRHNFEIKGISRATIDKFSRRTAEIEDLAKRLGIQSPEAKDQLGAKTRKTKKQQKIAADKLPQVWKAMLEPEQRQQFEQLAQKPGSPPPSLTPAQAVDLAAQHLFERQSVVRERTLLAHALLYGIGNTVDSIRQDVARRPWIREGKDEEALITTPQIVREEQQILAFARSGRGRLPPLAPNHQVQDPILGPEQRRAVVGLTASTDRLQIVTGVAGSGKTTLAREAIAAIRQAGHSVVTLAPTTDAVQVLNKDGLAADTVAGFLFDEKRQAAAAGATLWVDEAGLIGSPTMSKLLQVADRIQARVVLVGDPQQHPPIERGQPLQLLIDGGIRPYAITDIKRQQGLYKQAVEHLSRGQVLAGFKQLQELGFVHTLDDEQRYAQLASDYADAREQGKTTLAIAPTHAERQIVTDAIRSELQARGLVDTHEHELVILHSRQLTKAQRQDPVQYQVGDVIEFSARGKGGFKPGDRLIVQSVSDQKVWAQGNQGPVELPLGSAGAFEVFYPQATHFAAGDMIRITRKQREAGLANGSMHRLEGFSDAGELLLEGGRSIRPEWGHFDHGVAVTSYGSQGKTVQRVFVAQSSLSYAASSAQQAYVSASRGRERVDIYTDNAQNLLQAIAKSYAHRHATELASKTRPKSRRWRLDSLRQLWSSWQAQREQRYREATDPVQNPHLHLAK